MAIIFRFWPRFVQYGAHYGRCVLPVAGLLALAVVTMTGCTPSPYYTDPNYTEHNRPRTMIIREPAQEPRAVIIRDHDGPPQHRPSGHRQPDDRYADERREHREHREHEKSSEGRREHRGDTRRGISP